MNTINTNGELAFPYSVSCKEEFFHTFAKALAYNKHYGAMHGIIGFEHINGNLHKSKTIIVIYVPSDIVELCARRIERICSITSRYMDMAEPIIKYMKGSNAIIVELDKWYQLTPTSLSAMLTIIRMASKTNFLFNNTSPMNFINIAINAYNDLTFDQDAAHLRKVRRNKNLSGFLNKTLPCFKRTDYSAYKRGNVHNFSSWGFTYKTFAIPGIVEYSASKDNKNRYRELEPEDLLILI